MNSKNKTISLSVIEFINKSQNNEIINYFSSIVGIELPYIELLNIIKPMIENSFPPPLEKYFSSHISKDWIEDKFTNLDLFGSNGPIIIFDCELISKSELTYLKEIAEGGDRQVVLLFNKDLAKKWNGNALKIKKAAFWEGEQIFNLLSQYYEVTLSDDALSLVRNHLDSNAQRAFSLISMLKSFGGKQVNFEEIKSLIPPSNIDQFKLVENLNNKNLKAFYRDLSGVTSFEEATSLINFSISHLVKFIGPHGEDMKKNKYNRNIVQASSRWNEQELSLMIGSLKDLLVYSRLKNKKAFIEIMKASI